MTTFYNPSRDRTSCQCEMVERQNDIGQLIIQVPRGSGKSLATRFLDDRLKTVNPSSDYRLPSPNVNSSQDVMAPVQSTTTVDSSGCVLVLLGCNRRKQTMVTLYTFGDSILDCGRYNKFGVHPGQLLVHNDDRLFPEFQGQDLASRICSPRTSCLMAQQSMVYRFKLRDCGLKKGNCVDHRWQ